MPKQKPILDSLAGKFVSRKFLVFLVATLLALFTKTFQSSDWVLVAVVYIGGQSGVDMVERLISARKGTRTVTTAIKETIAASPPSKKDPKEQPTSDEATDPDKDPT